MFINPYIYTILYVHLIELVFKHQTMFVDTESQTFHIIITRMHLE